MAGYAAPHNDNFVTLREAARITSIHPNTIRRYGDAGLLGCHKTPAGHRRFSRASLQEFCTGIAPPPPVPVNQAKNILYSRVSSKKQLDDLSRQVEFLRGYRPEYINYVALSDIGSGVNFKRPGFQAILDAGLQGTLGEVVVTHRDRLCRFGFDLVETLIKKCGGTLVVIDDERHKTSEQELAEDLLSIVHIYSCRQMGKRSHCRRATKGAQDPTEADKDAVSDTD